jgi:hypothetical protein
MVAFMRQAAIRHGYKFSVLKQVAIIHSYKVAVT